jgi:cobalamin transport system ATP-binding protein
MPTLSIHHLSAGYQGRPVLHDIDLEVNAGEVVALVGPNGAGKSTLVRAITGLAPVSAGTVRLDGVDILRLSPAQRARQIAVVPQTVYLPEAFTVAEIVLMGRTPHLPLWGGESRRDFDIAWGAMQRTAVDSLADRRADELSGGERQRAVIARALAQEPRVLVLDEPTAHLDLKHQMAVLDLARGLAANQGLAVLATLHDLNQAALYADRVALLAAGRLLACGTVREVFAADRLGAAFGVPIAVSIHPVHGTPLIAPIASEK